MLHIPNKATVPGRKRVVVLGTGWGSFALAKYLDRDAFDVTVVSPRSHMLFTPLLASTCTGTLEHRSITQHIRGLGFRIASDFHLAKALDVDPEAKTVTCAPAVGPGDAYTLGYDMLVMGIGSQPNDFGMPGVSKHALFLKELKHARAIRTRLIDNLEEATGALAGRLSPERRQELLNVVVVGGGPTGIEFGGELYDLITSDVARLYPDVASEMRVHLVAGAGVLSTFHASLRHYAEDAIRSRSQMDLRLQNVTEVHPTSVTLDDGSSIPSACIVWAAGIGPRALTAHLGESRGFPLLSRRFKVDERLAVQGVPDVYAIGDCAAIQDNIHPQTAQVAETQGTYLAELLKALTDGKAADDCKPYHFQSRGALAYIGNYRGLADFSMAQLNSKEPEPEGKGSSFGALAGFHSWVIWRSAYLTKLGSWRSRFQVPFDWLKTLVFGRDLSRFSDEAAPGPQ